MIDELELEKMTDEERAAYQKGWQARNQMANDAADHSRQRELVDKVETCYYLALIALAVACIALLA